MAGITGVENLKSTVNVRADGYHASSFNYTLKSKKAHIFILDRDNQDMLPYCTMVEEKVKEYDLLHEKIYYMEKESTACKLLIGAEWQGKIPKYYILYQEGELGGERGKFIKQESNEFNLIPGDTFNPEQPVMLKLVASDGTESIPIQIGIVVNKNSKIEDNIQVNGDLLNQTSLTLGEDQSGSINDEKISAVFPNNFDFKISSLPVNVKGINNSKDGTYTVRMLIGFSNSNYLDDETKWHTFKEDFKSATKIVDNTDRLAGLMQAYDKQLGVGYFSIVSQWKPYMKGMGYYEETYDAQGNVVSQGGGIIICGGGKYSNTRQFLAGPVPIYINLNGAVELNMSQGIKFGPEGFELPGKINIMPSISLSGGVGVKGVVNVGVGGKALMNIEIIPNPKAEITLSAFIEASLIFVFNYSYDIGKKTIQLWPTQNNKKLSLARYLNEEEPDISLSDMDYTQHTTDWNQSAIERNKIVSLQDWILPGTIPMIKQVNNKTILIFQSTDSSKQQVNSTVLMYSVYENGCFSIPKSVYISQSADLFASAINYNDELYLVWQKQGVVLDNDDVSIMLTEALSKTEIYFSKWNNQTNTFDEVTAITNNNTMDMLPRIAVKDNEISVVWVNNSENNPYGLSGEYSVMKSVYSNNVWSEPQKIYSTEEFISEIAIDYDNLGKLNIAFTAYDAEQQDFSEIYILNDNGLSQITNNESEENGLQFFEHNLYWECEGSVNKYDLLEETDNTIDLQNCVVDSSFKMIKSGTKVAICWSDGQAIKAAIKINEKWSGEIELCDSDDKTIINMDALLLSDGSWLNVMNMREDENKTSICVVNSDIKSHISLDYVFASDTRRSNGIQPIEFSVTNNSENVLNNFNVVIKNDDDIYLDKEITCNIDPGETCIFIDEFELDYINKVTDFNIEIRGNNDTDWNNNEKSFQLGFTDVTVSVNQYTANGDIVLAVNVSNLSDTSSQATISILEDNEEGIVLDMKNIGIIEAKDEILYLYSINKDNIDFADKNAKHYFVKVDTDTDDYSYSNNSTFVVVYPESKIIPSDEEMIEIELVNVTGISMELENITLILSDENKDKCQMSAIIFPQNATYQTVEWSVDDESIVQISKDGMISAVSEGNTVVRVTSVDGGFSASANVIVLEEELENNVKIYFSNNKNWNNVYVYCFKSGTNPVTENGTWPGTLMNYKEQNIYNEQVYEIEIDANKYDYIIFSDGISQQTVDIPITGESNIGYYITDNSNSKYNVNSYDYGEKLCTIYFTDNYNWGNIHAYCFKESNNDVTENQSWPGVEMTYVKTNGYGEKIYSISIPEDKYDYIIFSNGSNSKQTVDISLDVLNNTGFYISGNQENKFTVSTYIFS